MYLSRLYSVGEELDEDDLDAELACLDDELDVSAAEAHVNRRYFPAVMPLCRWSC